jgi:Ca2+:H+ antiporter
LLCEKEIAMPLWAWIVPVVTIVAAAISFALPATFAPLVAAPAVIGAVLVAVHHAEVVAHRVGEPFGTLVLALAVTIIEVALILSVMIAAGSEMAALPRDTIFSAIMIIVNGVVGICILIGGLRHHEQVFRLEGANAGLAALMALATLTLVLPAFTTSLPGASYNNAQLTFASIASLALWGIFVFVQTVRHRDYFLPVDGAGDEDKHAAPPSVNMAWASFGLLIVSLVATVALAKALSPSIEQLVEDTGAPKAVVGIAIALLVLLPETLAAMRAAYANRLQTSFNLAFGSALASIGLTIPAVAIASILFQLPLTLGLDGKDIVFLVLSFGVASVTLVSGRTHIMQGAVHLVIFAAYLFLALVP